MNRIDSLRSPLFISWQLTRDCDLACLHCCTDSAPGKKLNDELNADEAMRVVADIVRNEVPYVMLCGGEPLTVPHFCDVAEALGRAGTLLKIETNGQQLDAAIIERLKLLPIRSIQISLDGDTQDVYASQRPSASLARTHAACRAVRAAGLPLEVTFAPTRLNIHQAEAVIRRARELGAFRFNTGKLMRIGRAARLWHRIEPSPTAYEEFRGVLDRQKQVVDPRMEICDDPFTIEVGLRQSLETPPATMLMLPNGWVKIAGALGYICGDLRSMTISEVWERYRDAWGDESWIAAVNEAVRGELGHAGANNWMFLT